MAALTEADETILKYFNQDEQLCSKALEYMGIVEHKFQFPPSESGTTAPSDTVDLTHYGKHTTCWGESDARLDQITANSFDDVAQGSRVALPEDCSPEVIQAAQQAVGPDGQVFIDGDFTGDMETLVGGPDHPDLSVSGEVTITAPSAPADIDGEALVEYCNSHPNSTVTLDPPSATIHIAYGDDATKSFLEEKFPQATKFQDSEPPAAAARAAEGEGAGTDDVGDDSGGLNAWTGGWIPGAWDD